MKFGVCRGLDDFESIKIASGIGVDYYECGFGSLAKFDDDKFNNCKEVLNENNLPCLVANGFLPGELKVVGDSIDYGALTEYLDKGFERAKALGVKKVVFGSGAARSFPEGYSLEKAKEQLAFFLREYASPKAEKAGCIIVMEPLRFSETSMIHRVFEGVEIARKSGKNNVAGLADLYHVYGNNDSIEGIGEFKGELLHSHIAEPVKRVYPSAKDSEEIIGIYKKFFASLKKAGCETCSVEAHTDDFKTDIADALAILKALI
ncbi:MAG: sugar phosphate isomerase/epimerase [Ruminococcaceae bacterium]|nr:sugar phosphate isomerase/epimerase [Oscillospiraceae bacterium]